MGHFVGPRGNSGARRWEPRPRGSRLRPKGSKERVDGAGAGSFGLSVRGNGSVSYIQDGGIGARGVGSAASGNGRVGVEEPRLPADGQHQAVRQSLESGTNFARQGSLNTQK